MRFHTRVLIGAAAGAVSYAALLWLHGPWEEAFAAALIGAAAGAAEKSAFRIALAAAACSAGWLAATFVFSVWIELGIGSWLGAGACLGFALAARRGWQAASGAALTGLLAGTAAEALRFLPIFVEGLRGVDMQLLLLVSAGLLLNAAAAVFAPRPKAAVPVSRARA